MISVNIKVNNSPFSGKEGDKLTMNLIKERLIKEAENDVALAVNFVG
jgi:GTP-binding protein